MHLIHLDETDSTNRWLRDQVDNLDSEELTTVWADHQTAGRGCGTNKWESDSGQNLLFSVLCHPKEIPATQQFLVLEAMALAVRDTLNGCLPKDETIRIKWPNDIYWHDSKLGGTLTECALSGQHMRWCIIGTGLNINQTQFSPALPNPVSLAQITNHRQQLEPLLRHIITYFGLRLEHLEQGGSNELHYEFMDVLYRRHGYYTYHDSNGDFEAEIVTIDKDGTLTLRDRMDCLRQYKFKEVSLII